MKVILTRDVPKVGRDGEIVTVADGFARNYLFPRQLAVVAKGAPLKQHANRINRELARSANLIQEAQQKGVALSGKEFQIVARGNPKSTRLFGSVTEADVAETIKRDTGIEVDKRRISLVDPIKQTGRYELSIRLHPEVTAPFAIEVVTPELLETREKLRRAAEEKAAREAERARQEEERVRQEEERVRQEEEARRAADLEAASARETPAPAADEYDEIPDAEG